MDTIKYCEHKILLKAECLSVPDHFKAFWKAVKKVGKTCGVGIRSEPDTLHFGHRKVYFFDSRTFDLYKNAFILRKRVRLSDGLPTEHEVTFKFRHADLATARSIDIRTSGPHEAKTKFKEEILPPRDGSSGFRSIFSHNSVIKAADITVSRQFAKLAEDFPALGILPVARDAPITLVNDTIVDELETETGGLDFGHGYEAASSIAVWHASAGKRPLTGEFSFQTRFDDAAHVDRAARDLALRFYQAIQTELAEWLAVGTTKTSLIYGGPIGQE